MIKIRWSDNERLLLLEEVRKQYNIHPTMNTLDLVRMAQKIALPSDRRRELTGVQQVEWVDHVRVTWSIPVKEGSVFIETPVPPLPPKPDLTSLLIELLSDAMVGIFAEAMIKAREKLDLPVVVAEPRTYRGPPAPTSPCKKHLTKIVIYGLMSIQEQNIRDTVKDCFELRFLKDVNQHQLVSGAQWADHFILMTRFISHDYEAIKKFKNIRYVNGGVSALTTELEQLYLEQC